LRGLWPADELAPRLGQELGRGEVLFRRLQKEEAVRHLVLILGDQLNRDASAFDGFDPAQDGLWMAELVQEIGLVLAGIGTAYQLEQSIALPHLCVMPGRDLIRAQCLGFLEKGFELDLTIAQYIRVGSAPGSILGKEMGEHIRPVGFGEIAGVKGDAQPTANGQRILAVLFGTALAIVFLVPVLHEQAADSVTLLLEQQRSHRGIDAA
jgi:hypothetical protein